MSNIIKYLFAACKLWVLFAFWFSAAPMATAQTMSKEVQDSNADKVSFDAIQPILRKHCVRCHNEDQPRGDLVLTSLDKVLAGSSSGLVVVAGKLEESPLYTLTAHLETPKMPPNKPQIPQRELNLIERWIMSGLADESKAPVSNPDEPNRQKDSEKLQPQSIESRIANSSQSVYAALREIPQLFAVRAISAHPTEPVVAIAGLHQVAVLNTNTASFEKQAIEIGERNVSALRFSPDGKFLLIGVGVVGESGTVLVLDWATKQWLPNVGEESDNIQSIDCNSDASQIAIGTTSRTIKTLDRTTQKELHVHRKHTDWVVALAYSPDGLLLASGDRFGGIHVWEAESGAAFATLRGHTSGISGLSWTEDGNRLISASLDGSIRVWDMHTFEEVKQIAAHERGVLSLAHGPKGTVFSAGRDGWIRKWSMDSSRPEWQSQLADEAITVCSLQDKSNSNLLICSDAAGGLYQFQSPMSESTDGLERRSVTWPIQPRKRDFASMKPVAIKRSSESGSAADSESRKGGSSDKAQFTLELSDRRSVDVESKVATDLDESRRALASVEQSLAQTYRTAEQLEETAARLKQMIAIQEARLKQAEIRQKSNQK